ncbi:hypothetical protein [Acinetobacter junii]|uniref:hypothetical protein n=1 Tax=Acinetobacter junii TaxID=40215 RepID=UPI000F66129A|nr:hypothetical protein [Acinetobacter junii]RSE30757.1 hypothetical protein EGT62_14675 [Acinetobacter junii]
MAGDKETQAPPSSAFQFKTQPFDVAKQAEGGKKRTFTGVAYSGEVIQGHYWWGDVVFDLDTMQVKTPLGALIDHDTGRRAGVVTSFNKDNQGGLQVVGDLLSNKYGQEVAQDSDEGYPWEMSVYISPGSIEEVERGEVTVNGRTLKAPITIFRHGVIREVSFCALGADDNTSAVAASHTPKQFNKQQEDIDVTELEKEKEARIAAEKQRDDALTELKQFKEKKRADDIAALETELKVQFSAEDKSSYTLMDDAAFTFATKQLRQFSAPKNDKQPNSLQHLFKHQAQIGQGGSVVEDQEHKFSAGAKAFASQNKGK